MCVGSYNDLTVPNVSSVEVMALESQQHRCETSLRLDRCNHDCDNCIFHTENFSDFIELYEKQMTDIL